MIPIWIFIVTILGLGFVFAWAWYFQYKKQHQQITRERSTNTILKKEIRLREHKMMTQIEALQRQEKQLRNLIESGKNGIFAIDQNYCLQIANTTFINCIKELGLDIQIGDSIKSCLLKKIIGYQDFIVGSTMTHTFEEVIQLQNGNKKHVEIVVNKIPNFVNKSQGAVFFVTDISERKKAEKVLKINQNRLESLMQNLQGMVYRLASDQKQSALFISDGVVDLMKIQPEEFTNRQDAINQYIIADYREDVSDKIKKAFEQKLPVEIEYPILIQGKIRWFLEKAHPVMISNQQLILEGFITDITVQVEAKEKLRRSEQLLKNYTLYTRANMFIKNLAGEYMQVNPHMCKMLNLEREDILDRTDYELYTDDIANSITSNDMYVMTSGEVKNYEQIVRLEDQTERVLLTSKFPLRDKKNQIYAVGGISFDITERKKTEQELISLKDNLENAVHQKTEKLESSNKRLTNLIADYRYQTQKLQAQEEELRQNMDRLNDINTILKSKQEEVNMANERFEILHSGANEGLWDWHFSRPSLQNSTEKQWVSEQYKKLLLGKTYVYKAYQDCLNIQDWKSNIHPEDKELIINTLKNHLEDYTGKTPYQVEFRVKVDEEYRWFRERCNTIRDQAGAPTRSVGSLQDITDEQLLKSKIDNLLVRYNLAFSSTKEGIWDIKLREDEHFSEDNIWISPQLKKLWQIQDDENWLSSLTKRNKLIILSDLKALIHTDQAHCQSCDHEYLITLPNQKKRWFRAVGSTVYDHKSKRYTRIAGIISDITDKKELEKLKENLQKEVNQQTQILSNKNEELTQTLTQLKSAQTHLVNSEKMASLGQLTAGIAHEINNPISYIGASIEGLQISIADILEVVHAYEKINTENATTQLAKIEALKEEIEYDEVLGSLTELALNINTGAKRTAQIVKGLRHFSRLDEDILKRSNLHHGLDSTLLLLGNKMRNRIEIVKHYDPKIQDIECFPGQLNQVFMNILSNAIQAIDGPGKIFIQTKAEEDNTKICIWDTGMGISESIKNRIFEPFFTTKDVGEGTGLGLSISYGIIERHHGTIKAENTPEGGAKFTIKIPKKINSV